MSARLRQAVAAAAGPAASPAPSGRRAIHEGIWVRVRRLTSAPLWRSCLQVWRNHAGLVEALLAAGADPDARDGESGWSPLHRALHGGQLRIAAALLAADASLSLPDWRGRSPLDLLSAELKEYLAAGPDGAADGDVFAWGALRACSLLPPLLLLLLLPYCVTLFTLLPLMLILPCYSCCCCCRYSCCCCCCRCTCLENFHRHPPALACWLTQCHLPPSLARP